ncbi:hypothetical protein CDO44_06140 [Pigmentiphaga sp. NML080357]|uniref:DUF6356 family protein n=1 Tax=Pigmentiphaga sp. NML080357 TaxID=2008675 RepID=UPI000B41FE6D|nr:DUF6356 family protein [Pigmentiphaga sp. NML080357]OVZ61220.1 hypothetical protein CDO44_06140 [Pigmentiphaga sp. NML080357]
MRKWSFTSHPASVGESYFEHLAASWGFARRMFTAALAGLVHGLFPFLCVSTGSSIVKQLNERMVVNRVKGGAGSGQPSEARNG